ncbi:fimbrial protein [Enterobacter roggenkampii]|nr:P pilus assembly protein%2C pilin FimA [Enterobacter cloacae]
MDRGENNNGAENNSLTFSAAPASATGAQPKPGTFEAYATVTLEIEH